MTSPAVPDRDGVPAAAAVRRGPGSARAGEQGEEGEGGSDEERRAEGAVRIDSMVPTRPSRAEASAGLSPASGPRRRRRRQGPRRRASAGSRCAAPATDLLAERQLGLEQERCRPAPSRWPWPRGCGRAPAISSRPSISPAWRPHRPAAGAEQTGRLREAGRAEDRQRQPHARAAQREGDRGQRTADPRRNASPARPPAARSHRGATDRRAPRRRAGGPRTTPPERADDDRAAMGS
jgi:hypothetical protein